MAGTTCRPVRRRHAAEGLGQYVETTEHLLRAVGDRLAEATRTELAAGVDAGEDIDQLRGEAPRRVHPRRRATWALYGSSASRRPKHPGVETRPWPPHRPHPAPTGRW
ncbi:hypothetical protein ACFPN0_32155 [Kitasatospora cinereorecta]